MPHFNVFLTFFMNFWWFLWIFYEIFIVILMIFWLFLSFFIVKIFIIHFCDFYVKLWNIFIRITNTEIIGLEKACRGTRCLCWASHLVLMLFIQGRLCCLPWGWCSPFLNLTKKVIILRSKRSHLCLNGQRSSHMPSIGHTAGKRLQHTLHGSIVMVSGGVRIRVLPSRMYANNIWSRPTKHLTKPCLVSYANSYLQSCQHFFSLPRLQSTFDFSP